MTDNNDNNNEQNNNNTFESPFKSQNDLDTHDQSTSSKAKNALLKKAGFESVESITDMKSKYDVLTKAQKKTDASNNTDLQNAQNDLQLSQSANNLLESTNAELTKGMKHQENLNIVLQVDNLNKDYANDVHVLANAMVSDDMDFKTAVSKVIERHPNWAGQQDNSFGFGTDSNSKDQKPSTMQELYDEAKKNGKLIDRIKIKQEAFKKGVLVT